MNNEEYKKAILRKLEELKEEIERIKIETEKNSENYENKQ